MEDISLHILDIVQNSLSAGATEIFIGIIENSEKNILEMIVQDNGKGIKKEIIDKVVDPFYTTRKTRKVGIGLSLLKQNAEQTGGFLSIKSIENYKTIIKAHFKTDSIDMIPIGNIALTLKTIISANPDTRIRFFYRFNNETFILDTNDVKSILDKDTPINNKDILDFLYKYIDQNIKVIKNSNNIIQITNNN